MNVEQASKELVRKPTCSFRSNEGLRLGVVDVEVLADGLFELSCGAVRAATNAALRVLCETALDLIGP